MTIYSIKCSILYVRRGINMDDGLAQEHGVEWKALLVLALHCKYYCLFLIRKKDIVIYDLDHLLVFQNHLAFYYR